MTKTPPNCSSMELPQPQRPLGPEAKKPTHDFLSLYNDSSFQHPDPRSTQGFYLKTQDFLQPLERVGKSDDKGEGSMDISTGKIPSVEHVLPGGIGTYSISHISAFSQGGGKLEKPVCAVGQTNSSEKAEIHKINSNSYNGGAFTLWEESSMTEKRVMKESLAEIQPMRERRATSVADLPFLANGCFNRTLGDKAQLSPLSVGKAKVAQSSQGFVEIMKPVKGVTDDDEDEEEEYLDRSRDTRRESSSQKGDVAAKVDGKNNDQRASTPRSKHSATEQRRRSKINDRFQILRELVPHSDQKRDKASFLLEVIEYIQFLQEKVQKYETSYHGWNQDKMKMMPWKNSQGPGENTADHSRSIQNSHGPGYIFTGKFDDNSTAATSAMARGILLSDAENMATPPPPQFQQRPWPVDHPIQTDASNEQEELAVEGGVISVSSLYSQGLLDTLTQTLQSSGLNLSQASISVQINLGKRGTIGPSTTTSSAKDEDPSSSRAAAHLRATSSGGDSEQAQKRPKTERGG